MHNGLIRVMDVIWEEEEEEEKDDKEIKNKKMTKKITKKVNVDDTLIKDLTLKEFQHYALISF